MAEALLRQASAKRFDARSAGVMPANFIHPLTLVALAEVYVPTNGLFAKPVAAFAGQAFDRVITLSPEARDLTLPILDVSFREHWQLPDPSVYAPGEQPIDGFRYVRDQLIRRIANYLSDI